MITKEEEQVQKRLLDLAGTAWRREIITYSDFLSLHEQSIYQYSLKDLSYIRSELA